MRLAVFGSPVAHSLSPAMHGAALQHMSVSGTYEARDVDEAALYLGVAELRTGELDGVNITMPHKRVAYELCDEVTGRAQAIGAVNTLMIRDGALTGYNTDVAGIRSAWEVGGLPASARVIVLGAGGAAAAALVALQQHDLYVVARRPVVAERLVDRVDSEANVIEWGDPVPSGVIVNATSVGMQGELLPDVFLDSATGLVDMPYGDVPTRSVRVARRRGVPVADGLDMLVGQAAESFAIWTGMQVNGAVFRAAAEAELEQRMKS